MSKEDVIISPSILDLDQSEGLEANLNTVRQLAYGGCSRVHVDVMDPEGIEGKYIERRAYGQESLGLVEEISRILPLDVHLMVGKNQKYAEMYFPLQPDVITFHPEFCSSYNEAMELTDLIKKQGIKVGLAMNPKKHIHDSLIMHSDLLLFMTVQAGAGGQSFHPGVLEKINDQYVDIITEMREINPYFEVQLDGGIKIGNVNIFKNMKDMNGNRIINNVVSGSGLLKAEVEGKKVKPYPAATMMTEAFEF